MKNRKNLSVKIMCVITACWFCLLVFLSHQGGPETAQTSSGLAKWVYSILMLAADPQDGLLASAGLLDVDVIDTLLRRAAHVILFLVWAALLLTSLLLLKIKAGRKAHPWVGFICCIVYAWADEATKIWFAGRHFSWFDTGLNAAGCVIGWLVYLVFRRILFKREAGCGKDAGKE